VFFQSLSCFIHLSTWLYKTLNIDGDRYGRHCSPRAMSSGPWALVGI